MVTLAEQVVRTLSAQGRTLAVAESCTGGLVGSLLTDIPGSSRVYPGGVVASANAPKRQVLGVPATLLAEHGAVSGEVAAAMAEGVCRLLDAEYGLGITGITGPTGGTDEKPVGTVFIACAGPNGVTVERHQWTGDREHNKHKSAMAALTLVLRRLEEA
jgi:nicotinamide-nucleotide amidase